MIRDAARVVVGDGCAGATGAAGETWHASFGTDAEASISVAARLGSSMGFVGDGVVGGGGAARMTRERGGMWLWWRRLVRWMRRVGCGSGQTLLVRAWRLAEAHCLGRAIQWGRHRSGGLRRVP